MSQMVVVAGVGMVPFAKPGASDPYHVMGAQAARLGLQHNPGLGGACVVTMYKGS